MNFVHHKGWATKAQEGLHHGQMSLLKMAPVSRQVEIKQREAYQDNRNDQSEDVHPGGFEWVDY